MKSLSSSTIISISCKVLTLYLTKGQSIYEKEIEARHCWFGLFKQYLSRFQPSVSNKKVLSLTVHKRVSYKPLDARSCPFFLRLAFGQFSAKWRAENWYRMPNMPAQRVTKMVISRHQLLVYQNLNGTWWMTNVEKKGCISIPSGTPPTHTS